MRTSVRRSFTTGILKTFSLLIVFNLALYWVFGFKSTPSLQGIFFSAVIAEIIITLIRRKK